MALRSFLGSVGAGPTLRRSQPKIAAFLVPLHRNRSEGNIFNLNKNKSHLRESLTVPGIMSGRNPVVFIARHCADSDDYSNYQEIEAEKSLIEKDANSNFWVAVVQRDRMEKAIELVRSNFHATLKTIEKAIVQSNLGLTPSNDGECIRLGIPQLTSERRKELSKLVAKQAEDGKDDLEAYTNN
ncbi:hypothetical protein HPP92_000813 [Vanilla planifolia]|uniref:Ribosome-recycling factor, chloroplastic n=1 Tax=Vanilla planifolia TaxID=51239 RepID=A0A835S253_VANPL|nr:hypothetical protein HPP92_000813 [Vanilla planifolia]